MFRFGEKKSKEMFNNKNHLTCVFTYLFLYLVSTMSETMLSALYSLFDFISK